MTVGTGLQLATSIGTLFTAWVIGDRRPWAWHVALTNQGLWWILVFTQSLWGLIPVVGGLTVVYARNLWKWRTVDRRPVETRRP